MSILMACYHAAISCFTWLLHCSLTDNIFDKIDSKFFTGRFLCTCCINAMFLKLFLFISDRQIIIMKES